MGKNTGKKTSKTVSGKYSQKLLDQAKQYGTDALKTSSKRVIQKRTEATVDLIGNKITGRITIVSKTSQQNNSETVTNENDKIPTEIPTVRYNSRRKTRNYWWTEIKMV